MDYYKKLEERNYAIDEREKDAIKKSMFTGLFSGGVVVGIICSYLITIGAFLTMFFLTWRKIM